MEESIFLKFGKIEGPSTNAAAEKEIPLTSYQFGVGRAVSSAHGGGHREGSTPSLSEVTVSKLMDKTTTLLLEEACCGTGDNTATITQLRSVQAGGKPVQLFTIKMEKVLVSGYSISASEGSIPNETLSLNFSKVTWTYFSQKDDGTSEGNVPVGWDLETNKKV